MTRRWWEKNEVAFADLLGGLAHLNRGTDGDIDAEYDRYARALKCLAKGYCFAHYEADDRREKTTQIRRFVRDAMMWSVDRDFIDGKVFRNLVQTSRQVEKLDLSKIELSDVKLDAVSEAHRRLVKATAEYDARQDGEAAGSVGYRVGALLDVVRCTLDDADTTPSGSDAAKAERYAEVVSAALPVLEELVLQTLEQPQYRLAVYGSLRRGEPNHHHIADLGDATDGTVIGRVVQRASYPVFRWHLNGDDVPVEVYSSTRLTPEKWESLNEFEGDGYRRLLIPVRDKTSGERIVATIYADARS